jgi:hypothetical protein
MIIQGNPNKWYSGSLFNGAAGAYSLRKIIAGYKGNAIEVRRSSDDATMDIPFVGQILDVGKLMQFVGSGSGYVTKWYDQSGGNRLAYNATPENQPLIVDSGELVKSGHRPALKFNGTSQFLMIDDFDYSMTDKLFISAVASPPTAIAALFR